MLTWSSTPPTVPGWYWRKADGFNTTVIELTEHQGTLGFWINFRANGTTGFTAADLVEHHGWQFAGPIPFPQENVS